MKNAIYQILVVVFSLATGIMAMCSDSGSRNKKMMVDSVSPMGAGPDNNAANNPSLADTAYERNRTRPITDTMKKDSVR